MYQRLLVTFLASLMPLAVMGAAVPQPAHPPLTAADPSGSSVTAPLAAVITKSEGRAIRTVTDSTYDGLFAAPSAEAGVRDIIKAGRFRINGFAIPADAQTLAKDWPKGYTVNGTVWLAKEGDHYVVDKKTYTAYDDAALAVVKRIPAGLEIRIYDQDGDHYGDAIEASVWEAIIPQTLDKDDAGNILVRRLSANAYPPAVPGEGRAYDASHFTEGSGEKVAPENMDASIRPGDMALFAYTPSGWTLRRAIPVTGPLQAAKDHRYYQLNGIRYHDAMRFSRDNLPISNRCGEFINTLHYFKAMHRPEAPAVTLWLVPTSSGQPGAPAGFTSGDSAAPLLKQALRQSWQHLAHTAISTDGRGVPAGKPWMTPSAYHQATEVITAAQKVYDQHQAPVIMDYERYLLYLALNGGQDDIGARYAGYDFEGIHQAGHAGH